jgi:hypothetical protein
VAAKGAKHADKDLQRGLAGATPLAVYRSTAKTRGFPRIRQQWRLTVSGKH